MFGDNGNDIALLGAGNDLFTWDPGDGSDIIEGQDGIDTMDFNGAGVGENVTISANGQRVNFFRDVANVTMDMDGVERIVFDALGGADNVVINDLSGTAADEIVVNLGAAQGSTSGDGAADSVSMRGGAAAETIKMANAIGGQRACHGSRGRRAHHRRGDRQRSLRSAGRRRQRHAGRIRHSRATASSSACSAKPATTASSAAPARISSTAAWASTRCPGRRQRPLPVESG